MTRTDADKLVEKVADSMVDMAHCALTFGRIDRTCVYHPDGGPKESDTDHTVMLGWVACSVAFVVAPTLDVGKVAQMALAHDAVEVYAGDTPTLRITDEQRAVKASVEHDAHLLLIERFGRSLPWLTTMISIYESRIDSEAKFVWALDKIMPKLVHLLDNLRGLHEAGMTRDELAMVFAKQRTTMAIVMHAEPWAEALMALRDELVGRVLDHEGWQR